MRLIDADALIGELHTQFFYDGRDRTRVYAKIQDQPTIEPGRKTGKWIKNSNGTYSCDKCHSWIPNEQHYYANFCLYCGADMRGEQDGKST